MLIVVVIIMQVACDIPKSVNVFIHETSFIPTALLVVNLSMNKCFTADSVKAEGNYGAIATTRGGTAGFFGPRFGTS